MIKLFNQFGTADYWLTVLNARSARLTPFYGDRVPSPLVVGQASSGVLDMNESAYYSVSLKKGDYTAILDFSHPKKENTNIIGYLALLDADGGNQRRVLRLNQMGVSHRAAGEVAMSKDDTAILRIQNHHRAVNYSIRITPQ